MKDYKEMTESVLQQAKTRAAQQAHQRRLATGLIAGTLCLAVLFAVVCFSVGRAPGSTTDPTIALQNPTIQPTETEPTQPETTEPIAPPEEVKVYYLSSNAKQVSQQFLLEGVVIPVGGEIRVRRFYDLNEEERKLAIQEEEAINKAFREENETDYSNVQESVSIGHSAMVSCLVKGVISLEFADKDHVSDVELEHNYSNGIAGASEHYTKEFTYGEGENQVTFPVGSMRYLVFWSIPSELELKLLNNAVPLSDVKDTITITINYSNGAQQTLIIDVTVDDDGYIYMTQRGNNTGV